jgi:hypothetical protein
MHMADRLVTVATFGSAIEAALAKNRLEEAGIPARLGEEETIGLFGSFMGPALGGVKLLVSEEHLVHAEDILAEVGAPEEGPEGEDAESDLSLAGDSSERDGSEDTDAITEQPRPVEPGDVAATAITAERPSPDKGPLDGLALSPADQLAKRAMLSALVGIVIFELVLYLYLRGPWHLSGEALVLGIVLPLLLHIYSVVLLIRLGKAEEELSRTAVRYMWIAVALDLLYLSLGTVEVITLLNLL